MLCQQHNYGLGALADLRKTFSEAGISPYDGSFLCQLPCEVIPRMLKSLQIRELYTCRLVCRKWNELAKPVVAKRCTNTADALFSDPVFSLRYDIPDIPSLDNFPFRESYTDLAGASVRSMQANVYRVAFSSLNSTSISVLDEHSYLLSGHSAHVRSLSMQDDVLASVDNGGVVRVWSLPHPGASACASVESHAVRFSLENALAHCVQLVPGSEKVCIGTTLGEVLVCSCTAEQEPVILKPADRHSINGLASSNRGEILSCANMGFFCVADPEAGTVIYTQEAKNSGDFTCVTASAFKPFAVTGSSNGELLLYDCRAGRFCHTIHLFDEVIFSAALRNNDCEVVCGTRGHVCAYDLRNLRPLWSKTMKSSSGVINPIRAISTVGDTIAVGLALGHLCLYAPTTSCCLTRWQQLLLTLGAPVLPALVVPPHELHEEHLLGH
eukprot:TRINITY_DN1622_c0_g1_i1.p1 TRINITY_DN1622_c0_g1~~TRINITY_DN1622_c0_g1_i1.p1  ORF type:complete len:440 (-),score=48.89 TRINITY_DN1622_c0_g1_i1:83-1402(-)